MHIQFAELPVVDQDRARDFYVSALACRVVADVPMGEGGWRWVELGLPGAATNLHFVRRRADQDPDMPVLVLVSEDVATSVAALKAKGATILSEPDVAPYDPELIVTEFRDSEGNRMVLSSPRGGVA